MTVLVAARELTHQFVHTDRHETKCGRPLRATHLKAVEHWADRRLKGLAARSQTKLVKGPIKVEARRRPDIGGGATCVYVYAEYALLPNWWLS